MPEDIKYGQKFGVPIIFSRSPVYRHLYRSCFLPSMKLHSRNSSLSGKPVLSMFSPDKPFPVYTVDEWWSDKWDALSFGRTYDFNLPFFVQFADLWKVVPRVAVYNEGTENCIYSINVGSAKNVYYSYRIFRSENVYYSQVCSAYNEELCDCLRCDKCRGLYGCINCQNCADSVLLYHSEGSRDCFFCMDCRGCAECLFCSNLRHKTYCINNRQLSKEEFLREQSRYLDGCWSTWQANLQKFKQLLQSAMWSATEENKTEDCIGDSLTECSNCYECYSCVRTKDSRYCWDLNASETSHDYFDVTTGGIGELMFNSCGCGGGLYFLRMCRTCRLSSNLTYCMDCISCDDCFGCIGLRHKQYCILNRQYRRNEYEELTSRIIAQMTAAKEWGSFFPQNIAAFCYNDSLAAQYLPLSRKQALACGFLWNDTAVEAAVQGGSSSIPDSIHAVNDEILGKTIHCEATKKAFRITRAELEFYRKRNIPLPRHCPDFRMLSQRQMLRRRWLETSYCRKCASSISTTVLPQYLSSVFCRECYSKQLY